MMGIDKKYITEQIPRVFAPYISSDWRGFQSVGGFLKDKCANMSKKNKYQPNFKTIRHNDPYVDANKEFDGNTNIGCGMAMTK